MVTRLTRARMENRVERALIQFVSPKVLIIDETGYLPMNRDECMKESRNIYGAHSRKEATEHSFLWAKKWRSRRPKAVACIEKDLEELLAFYACPKPLSK